MSHFTRTLGLIITLCLTFAHTQGRACVLSGVQKVYNVEQLSSGIKKGKHSFIIYRDVDLEGKTFVFPKEASIIFKGGCIKNGSVKGDFSISGVKPGSLSVYFLKGSTIRNRMQIYSSQASIDASVLSACIGGIELNEDLVIDEAIELKSSVEGNGHRIHRSTKGNTTIHIVNNKDQIEIHNLHISKAFDKGTINQSYCVYSINSSNILFDECYIDGRVYFVNNTLSDRPEYISQNIVFQKCKLFCDLSSSPQGSEYGQDHLTFCSVKNLSIADCFINSKNVNRVIKTTAYFSNNVYDKAVNCCDGIIFKNNSVIADCGKGKQFWDMFCGTVNVLVENNDIDIKGFTEVFENKAYQYKYKGEDIIESCITIRKNRIKSKHSSLFQFSANPTCDSFVFEGNECHLYGSNKNIESGFTRTSGSYLQGYKSCLIKGNRFYWEDEASGLMFTTFNFDCLNTTIENNYFKDVYRVNMASSKRNNVARVKPQIESFIYKHNKKEYTASYQSPQIEVAIEGVDAKNIEIEISNENTEDYYVSLNTDAQIDRFVFKSSGRTEKAICVLSDKVIINKLSLPSNCVRRGKNWYYNISNAK